MESETKDLMDVGVARPRRVQQVLVDDGRLVEDSNFLLEKHSSVFLLPPFSSWRTGDFFVSVDFSGMESPTFFK